MTIDNCDTKDDVLKLVAIDNINISSARKSITCAVFIVKIVLVFLVLTIRGGPVGRIYVEFKVGG